MSGTTDPWAAFRAPASPPTEADPWAAFRAPAAPAPSAPQRTPEQAAAREANSGVGGFIGGTQRAIEQGQTFGFRDEAAALLEASVNAPIQAVAQLFRGERPTDRTWTQVRDEVLARERARNADFADQHPVVSGVGNLVGGVMAPGAAFGRVMQASRGIPGAVVRGSLAGGTGGAISGFGDGEGGFAERAESAATGGLIGAGGGAALGLGANVGSRIGGRLLDVAGLRNPETAAERQILRALERDNRPLSDVAAEAAAPQGGAPLALADLGGRNTTSLAAVAANVPGRSMEAADALVQGRRAAGPDRIAAASDQAFGGGSGTRVADETAILDGQRRAAGPLYDQAFGVTLPRDPRLEQFLSDPDIRRGVEAGLGSARRGALADEQPFRTEDYGVRVTDDGMELVGDGLPTRLFDAAKRGLDSMIETARASGDRGRARELVLVRKAMLERVDDLNPAYAQARAAYAGPASAQEALETGAGALRLDRDVLAGVVANQTPANLDFLRIGAGRQVSDMASDPAKAPGVARRLLEDRQMQARLESLLPPDRNAALAEALRGEVRVNAGNAAYSPRAGSQTARLQAGMDDAQIDPPGGLVMALLNATQRGGITGAGAKGLEVLYRRGQGINSSTADALAKRLFSTDRAQNEAVVKALMGRRAGDTANEAGRRALMARILQGGGTATGLIAN